MASNHPDHPQQQLPFAPLSGDQHHHHHLQQASFYTPTPQHLHQHQQQHSPPMFAGGLSLPPQQQQQPYMPPPQQQQLMQLPPGMVFVPPPSSQHDPHMTQPAYGGPPQLQPLPPGFAFMAAPAANNAAVYDLQGQQQPQFLQQFVPQQQHPPQFASPQQQGIGMARAPAGRSGGGRHQLQHHDYAAGGGRGNRARRELVVPPPAPGDTEPGPRQLIVNYIAVDMTSEELRELFEPFGDVEVARVVDEPNAGHNRGFGFVYFRSCVDAAASIEGLSGRVLRGKRLRVSYAIPQRPIASEKEQHTPKSSNATDVAAAVVEEDAKSPAPTTTTSTLVDPPPAKPTMPAVVVLSEHGDVSDGAASAAAAAAVTNVPAV